MKLETYDSKQADFDALLARNNLKNTPKIVRKYNKILKKIEKTANKAKRYCIVRIPKSIYGIIVSMLREDGYTIRYDALASHPKWFTIVW